MKKYLDIRRGDRLNPWPLHSRYHALRQLAAAMRHAAAHPAVRGELLVDFGCGNAPYEPLLRPRFNRYIRADVPGNPRADITIDERGRLPLPDGAANAVLSSQVLEHVRDPRAYLDEAYRVLAPGGVLVLSTHGFWKYHPDPEDFWRWTRDGLVLELERAGFSILDIRGVLGRGATVVQLLQDAATDALPPVVRRIPSIVLQPLIGAIEVLRRDPSPIDAAIYVILASRVARHATSS